MVIIPLFTSHVVDMRFISKALICLSSMLMLLSTTTCATYEDTNSIKSATFVTKMFEVAPGEVRSPSFVDIDFPRGHIGVKSFDAEVIDEDGNSVPLYESYLHHWFAIRYYEKIWSKSPIPKNVSNPFDGVIFGGTARNDGVCPSYMLPHHWGLGGESRGTSSSIPDPYAVELGNPAHPPPGYEEKWLLDLMVIDTRGAIDRKGCTECRCDLFNIPKNFFNVTTEFDGKPLRLDYEGGLHCCKNTFKCKLENGFNAPTRKLALRYKIRWVEWNQHQIPLRFYILDATDRVKRNGSQIVHDCQVEYTIPKSDSLEKSPHIQKASIPMEKGGFLIYATAHMHTGVINATLYGQDGRNLCTSTPRYGTGKEPGNEKDYLVEMSVCYPESGSVKINDGEIVTIEARYERNYITGAMGHMYFYLANVSSTGETYNGIPLV